MIVASVSIQFAKNEDTYTDVIINDQEEILIADRDRLGRYFDSQHLMKANRKELLAFIYALQQLVPFTSPE